MTMSTPLTPAAVVGRLVCCLPLSVLLALHSPVLEPDLDLPLRQVEVPSQLPPEEEREDYYHVLSHRNSLQSNHSESFHCHPQCY